MLQCHQLKDLFSSHFARGLLCLKKISLVDCKSMETVVSTVSTENRSVDDARRDELDQTIEFPQLRTLTLGGLLCLTSFYSRPIKNPSPWEKRQQFALKEIIEESELTSPTPLFNEKVGFPKLEKLKLLRMGIEKIYDDQPAAAAEMTRYCSFKNLISLTVEGCGKLSYLFTFSTIKSLAQLKELVVNHCFSIEEIVATRGELMVADQMLVFPKLDYLRLKDLPKLQRFCHHYVSNQILSYPSLKQLWIEDCITLKTFVTNNASACQEANASPLFDQKIVFPKLEELELSGIGVEHIWNDQFALESFQNLTSLKVSCCENLSYVLTSSMVKSLPQLEQLQISRCDAVVEVIATNLAKMVGDAMFSFPKLEKLELEDLPELKAFYQANLLECQSLRNLRIQKCKELKTFTNNDSRSLALFDEKVAFPNLTNLTIHDMDHLTMIWGNELHPNSFSEIKTLNIMCGRGLQNVFPPGMWTRTLNLESLEISRCHSLKNVFDRPDVSNRKRCLMSSASRNLRSVRVEKCPALKSLFPSSIFLGLQQLEKLGIKTCNNMEEIVSIDHNGESCTLKFVFPKLKSLQIENSPQLERFYPGPNTSHWPSLIEVIVHDCDKIDLFGTQQHFKNSQQDAFAKLTANLKEYSFGREGMRVTYRSLSSKITFSGPTSQVFPHISLLQRFQHFAKLAVQSSHLEKLFPCELLGDDDTHAINTLARIHHLEVGDMSKMTHIWTQHPHLDQILRILETLKVQYCGCLISLAPSTALFQNLTRLDVRECERLVKLVVSSTARSLVQLVEMRVRECKSLTEIIIANDEREASNNSIEDVVFGKLKSLTLQSLANLTSFCSACNCNFKFPSLVRLILVDCPKMELFSNGVLSTLKLRRVSVNEDDNEEEGRWEGNLDSTIRKLWREMHKVGYSSMPRLSISELHELTDTLVNRSMGITMTA